MDPIALKERSGLFPAKLFFHENQRKILSLRGLLFPPIFSRALGHGHAAGVSWKIAALLLWVSRILVCHFRGVQRWSGRQIMRVGVPLDVCAPSRDGRL